ASECSNFNLSYIPHRREDDSLRKEIEEIGFRFLRFDKPLELVFIELETLPQKIFSLYSTTLITLPKVAPGVEAVAIELRDEALAEKILPYRRVILEYYIQNNGNIMRVEL